MSRLREELVFRITDRFPGARRQLWRALYDHCAQRLQGVPNTDFLNWGYDDGEAVADVPSGARMYLRALAPRLADPPPRLLEVGCGKGAGLRFLYDHVVAGGHPEGLAWRGLDLSSRHVQMARAASGDRGIEWAVGSADRLPFEAASLDAVLNVESSHCYPDLGAFLDEVGRVLVPGGDFLYCDFREEGPQLVAVREALRQRFDVQADEDISAAVVRASLRDAAARAAVLAEFPAWSHPWVRNILALEGSDMLERLRSGQYVYFAVHARRR